MDFAITSMMAHPRRKAAFPEIQTARSNGQGRQLGAHHVRSPEPWRGLTINERSLAGTHGQIGAALTLSAVRPRGHSFHSQADNAVTIRAVPAACPNSRQLTANRGLRQCSRLARSSDLAQGIRHIKLVPKLTVRVPAPLPATHEKTLLHKELGAALLEGPQAALGMAPSR